MSGIVYVENRCRPSWKMAGSLSHPALFFPPDKWIAILLDLPYKAHITRLPPGGIGFIPSLRSNCIAILLLDLYTVYNFFEYKFAESQRMASEKLLDSSLTDVTTLLDTTIFDLNLFVHKQ